MALFTEIPDDFVESYYQSKLRITIDDESKTMIGMYHPPWKKAGLGLSLVEATVTNDEFGYVVLNGVWQHIRGPENGGRFQMKINERGQGVGWFTLPPASPVANQIIQEDEEEKNIGQLAVEKMGKNRELTIDASQGVGIAGGYSALPGAPGNFDPLGAAQFYWAWAPARAEDYRKSPGKVTRKTRLVWLENLVNSAWLSKFSIASAWLFFLMTLVSLSISATDARLERWGSKANAIFNTIYTVIYSMFLIAYYYLKARPNGKYMAGVLLYTVGYLAFALLYFYDLWATNPEREVKIAPKTEDLYNVGSICFLIGSLLLCLALPTTQYCKPKGYLLWGSILFLVGATAFTLDSTKLAEKIGSYTLVIFGNACFLPGRLCFLYGSSTTECNVFFMSQKSKLFKKKLAEIKPLAGKRELDNWEEDLTSPRKRPGPIKSNFGRGEPNYVAPRAGHTIN